MTLGMEAERYLFRSSLRRALALTVLAALLLYGWLTKDPLLWRLLNELGGRWGIAYLFLYALIAALAWGTAIAAALSWAACLRGRQRPRGAASAGAPQLASLRLARSLSLVAVIVVAVTAAAWSYRLLFPPACQQESCYYIGDAALPILLAVISAVTALLAVLAWSVYLIRSRGAGAVKPSSRPRY